MWGYTAPDGATANEAFVRKNQTLRDKVASGAYPDVALADWFGYTSSTTGWLASDGIHLTGPGALGVGDYISRRLAFLDGGPCPQPWVAGRPADDPCPNPGLHGPVADIRALYP